MRRSTGRRPEGATPSASSKPGWTNSLRERHALQHDLRLAIERNEFALHYQPQARIDGEVFGFEALIRWRHPHWGMVPPANFVPVAEEHGLITQIGEWVLRQACGEAASLALPVTVAVNLSPIQFRHGDLPGLVHEVLLETGLAPDRLELEITESVLIDDLSRVIGDVAPAQSAGREDGDGRLRHGLFVAVVAASRFRSTRSRSIGPFISNLSRTSSRPRSCARSSASATVLQCR